MARTEDSRKGGEVVAAALRAHFRELEAFVRSRLPPEEAAEVLQTAAVRAIERSHTLQDPERVRAWLFRLVRNVMADSGRKRGGEQHWIDANADAEVSAVSQATPSTDASCGCSASQARRIDSDYASILRLVDVDEGTLAEAAQVLKISANNAAVRLHRARKALRKQMFEHCGVTSARECLDCRCVYEGCCAV